MRHDRCLRSRRSLVVALAFVGATGLSSKTRAAQGGPELDAELGAAGMPYDAFDRMPGETFEMGGSRIRVVFGPGSFDLAPGRITEHVRRSARTVAAYFGRFPAATARVLVLGTSSPGRPVRSGTAFGDRGAAIKLTLANSVRAIDLERDWILVHEMCHLALPSLPRRHHWLEEGMASYVEPMARAQAGLLSPERVWGDMVKGLPQGLPQSGDRGLDRTWTWGRTYWGGALFCLLADVESRAATAGERGLQHALRAILQHGNIETDSPIEPLLEIGDGAIGAAVLTSLYARMKDAPYPVDLDELWHSLGVRAGTLGVQFDDAASQAATRLALTRPIAGRG